MKKVILLLVGIVFVLSACNMDDKTQQVNEQQSEQQGELLSEAQKECGMPALTNFQERKMMKCIIEARDKANHICYAYLFAQNIGKLIYIGRCVGYGLPYSTQYTNPEKVEWHNGGVIALPQADPNGLYMPSDAHGTWLLMLTPKGDTTPVYVEPDVIVSPFKLQ